MLMRDHEVVQSPEIPPKLNYVSLDLNRKHLTLTCTKGPHELLVNGNELSARLRTGTSDLGADSNRYPNYICYFLQFH